MKAYGEEDFRANLMRNIVGSVGIAVATTMTARGTQKFSSVLGRHVNPYDLQSQQLFDRLRAASVAQGSDIVTPTQQAYAVMFGLVQKQAALLSSLNAFWFVGLVFLLMLPLIFLMKKPSHGVGTAPVH